MGRLEDEETVARQLKPDPRETAAESLRLLCARANKKKAISYQRFFKEPVALLGIDTKTMRSIEHDLLDDVAKAWTIRDAVSFCKTMIREKL